MHSTGLSVYILPSPARVSRERNLFINDDDNLKLLDAKLMLTSDWWLLTPKDAENLLMDQPSIKLVL
jgi:hypothetical protein